MIAATWLLSGLIHATPAGEYLVRLAGCADCHTASPARPFAGGRAIKTPFGTFFTPNISPSFEGGIGAWTFETFKLAVREGRKPGTGYYYPAFPYRAFRRITDKDLYDIYLYLRGVRPFTDKNRAHFINFPYDQRWLLGFWRLMFLDDGPKTQDPSRSAGWNRGAYLIEGLLHCTECHTPRDFMGALDTSRWMLGAPFGSSFAPNLTALGWSLADWSRFLSTGFNPARGSPGIEMAEVVRNTAVLTASDRESVIEYLRSLPPGENLP